MQLSKQEIEHVARLARLELTEAEKEQYQEQLSAVLSYIDQLQEVDTSGVLPTAQVTGLSNAWRDDVVDAWPEDQIKAAMSLAPEQEDGQYKVKRILE
ncbi:MAG: Asp-tRNA(Asn)/Glu-tRNA(Gln) amidotransferase subunit GatC [Candidatus Falkowbacteria bacterium]